MTPTPPRLAEIAREEFEKWRRSPFDGRTEEQVAAVVALQYMKEQTDRVCSRCGGTSGAPPCVQILTEEGWEWAHVTKMIYRHEFERREGRT